MTNDENLNPVGLALTQLITVALKPLLAQLVAQAVIDHISARSAAIMLDDELERKVIELIEKNTLDEDRVREIATQQVERHEDKWDHDEFAVSADIKGLVEGEIEAQNLTPVDADNDDFTDAVRSVIRNHI